MKIGVGSIRGSENPWVNPGGPRLNRRRGQCEPKVRTNGQRRERGRVNS